jgi:hypothetical protein
VPDLVHIEIRRDPGITLDEWKAVVSASPDMRLVHTQLGRNPRTGDFVEASTPNVGEWTGHPDGGWYPFWFLADYIEVQWADEYCESKARALAAALHAEVSVRPGD